MDAICNFLPPANENKDISYYLFVYEADLCKLSQPFVHNRFYMHLSYKGEAVLRTEMGEYTLTPGTLFITFPGQKHSIIDNKGFTYLYITFDGPGAQTLLRQFGISKETPVFEGFSHIMDFWITSIRRVHLNNIVILTESVLLYTLSYIDQCKQKGDPHTSPLFDSIIQYIHNNFADPDLSIVKLANIFGFSRKYLSARFAKNMGVNFTEYLTKVRIEHAIDLLCRKGLSVAEIAVRCGYSDPFYFSKVFKRITGVSPSKY